MCQLIRSCITASRQIHLKQKILHLQPLQRYEQSQTHNSNKNKTLESHNNSGIREQTGLPRR